MSQIRTKRRVFFKVHDPRGASDSPQRVRTFQQIRVGGRTNGSALKDSQIPPCSPGLQYRLRIEKTCLSPAVSRMVGRVGATVSFKEGSQLLEVKNYPFHARRPKRAVTHQSGNIVS